MGDYRAVVFSKVYDRAALAAAASLKAAGARVILDLCDNHFYGEEINPVVRERAGRIEAMIQRADVVVTSTDALKSQVEARFPRARGRSVVIPDYLEELPSTRLSLFDRLALRRLERFFAETPHSLRLIWFGNHGGGPIPAGMVDLERIRRSVEAHAVQSPVTLTVMSNSHHKYRRLIRPWAAPTTYVSWTVGRADPVMRRHDVAVIPINRNPFTVAKTLNRPATAILAGLGVIADAIPSYEELRPFIPLDDWPKGLRQYADIRPAADPQLAAARTHLLETYKRETISGLWRTVLQD